MRTFNYHGYVVQEDGVVIGKHGRPMRVFNNGRGYSILSLLVDKKPKTIALHRLLAIAFIENPENLSDVDHIDGDRQNNSLNNLRWVTHGDNIRHSYRLGKRASTGVNNPRAKLTEEQVKEIRNLYLSKTARELSSLFNVSERTIYEVAWGRKWKHVPQGSETRREP